MNLFDLKKAIDVASSDELHTMKRWIDARLTGSKACECIGTDAQQCALARARAAGFPLAKASDLAKRLPCRCAACHAPRSGAGAGQPAARGVPRGAGAPASVRELVGGPLGAQAVAGHKRGMP